MRHALEPEPGPELGGLIAAAAGTGAAVYTSCGLLLLSAVVLLSSRFRDAGEEQHLTGVFPH